MFKKLNELQKEAIAHHLRMQAWVKLQNPEEPPDCELMYVDIKEDWYGDDCPYCKENSIDEDFICPLSGRKKRSCNDMFFITGDSSYCCNGFWIALDNSLTWKEWLEYNKKIIEYIKRKG